jgi:AcrR family transcriptional regulator
VDLAEVHRRIAEFVGDIDPASKKGRKRRAILEAATVMFAEQGYRNTSMDELAAKVGVAKGTLYLYFPKKIDLLFACAALEKSKFVPGMIEMLNSELPAADKLKRWLIAVLTIPSKSPLLCRLISGDQEMAELIADYPPELRSEMDDGFPQLLNPLLEEIAGPEHRWSSFELRDRANVLRSINFLAPLLRHEWMRPGMSAERFAAIMADLIVDGLRPRSSGSQGES